MVIRLMVDGPYNARSEEPSSFLIIAIVFTLINKCHVCEV